MQEIDAKRLEYDEIMFPSVRKPIAGMHKGTSYKESYTPQTDISEIYETRRVYGVMAGFDEAQKVITGLQLYQQGIIDKQTLQENIDGLDNITKINNRSNAEKAETVLFESLMAQAAQGDPKATLAAIEIRKNPQKMSDILDKYYTAEGDEPSPEEEQLLQQVAAPQQQAQVPPDVASALPQALAGGGLGG